MATLAGHGIVCGHELDHYTTKERVDHVLKGRMELINEQVEESSKEYHMQGDHVAAATILAFQTVSLEMSDYIYMHEHSLCMYVDNTTGSVHRLIIEYRLSIPLITNHTYLFLTQRWRILWLHMVVFEIMGI